MDRTRPSDAPWWTGRAFVVLALLATAAPLLWPATPPLVDLPGHMARYRVMLGDDPGLARWYAFGWRPIGYLGVDLLVLALAPLLGLEPAVKLIALLIPVLTAGALLGLSREAHGRIQPPALFALPLAYHFCFRFGFLNYTLGIALALGAFALWLRLGRLGRVRLRAASFVVLAAALWFVHLFAWIALGAMTGAAEVAHARAAGRGWIDAGRTACLRCLPLAPPALLLLRWRPEGGAGGGWLATAAMKPGWLLTVLRDRWEPFDLLSVAVLAAVLVRCWRSGRWSPSPPVLGAAAGLLALFVALPFGTAYADARIAPYLLMLLLVAPGAAGASPRELRATAALGFLFLAARTAAATLSFAEEGEDWDRRLRALDHVPRGALVITLATARCEASWRPFRLGHLPGMLVVRRGAFSNDQFDLGTTALLRVTAPGLGGFARDPSQIVMPAACAAERGFLSPEQALRRLPCGRVDYLWLLDPVPVDPRLLAGFEQVWSDGRDVLYRSRPTSRLSAPPASR